MVYGFMPGPEQVNTQISMSKGRLTAGNAIGILVMNDWYPYLPGDVANASTYGFPVHYEILEDITVERILRADPALLDLVIEGGKELQKHGVRAIVGACGYFGNYQKEVAAILDIPVFLSSLLQAPIIKRGLKPDQKVGIMCGHAESLTPKLLSQCGVGDLADVVIAGAQDLPEFQNILQGTGSFNGYRLQQELAGLAKQFVSDNPDISAILLECSAFPPFAWAIQNAVKLPVFDFTTLINWVYNAVVRRPFAGFV